MGRTSKKDEDKLPPSVLEDIANNVAHYLSIARAPYNDEKEVAKAAGLHPKTLQRIRLRSGAGFTLKTIVRLAKVWKIDPDLLLRRTMSGREPEQPENVKNSVSSAMQNTKKGQRE